MKAQTKLKEYNAKRDFKKTAEPEGAVYAKKSARLAYVIQKHEASHLHYDVRLELDGVMKSWACPKGPSFDPAVKRLAVQVEDHPTSYNDFEGTIPSGEYGGGTVMVWDKGYYTVDDSKKGDDPEELMREGLEKGKLSITFHGQKLRGSFAFVRTRMAGKKAQWLIIKHRDEAADPDYDPVGEEAISVKSSKTMAEIEASRSPVYSSKKKVRPESKLRAAEPLSSRSAPIPRQKSWGRSRKSEASSALMPMLIHTSSDLPLGKEWVYEQKLDGVRLLAYADENNFAIISRLGNDKSSQFPELGKGLKKMAKAIGGALLIDGEVVAIDKKKNPLGFQYLQGRIHLDESAAIQSEIEATPVEFYVFDILLAADTSVADQAWSDRRAVLDRIFKGQIYPLITLNPVSTSAKVMMNKAAKGAWEGLIAKDINSPYLPGVRTRNWLKWKMVKREELVIGGFTEPKGARKLIGSLLVGFYDGDDFVFAGHVGSGFNNKILKELHEKLCSLETDRSPFKERVVTNDVAHWVKPQLVAEIKFQEWTEDHILRQPIYLGIRDDKRPKEIVKQIESGDGVAEVDATTVAEESAEEGMGLGKQDELRLKTNRVISRIKARSPKALIKAIQAIDQDGELELPEGALRLTHLNKVVFPKDKITKRDLLEYYTLMSEEILPWMKDRPLVLRRFPGGIEAKDFYQQAPDDGAPGRIMTVKGEQGENQRRLIGGDLITLLYTIQMSCVSYDPWHSRIQNLDSPDYSIIDLDPVAGTSFETVRGVALAVLDFMDEKGLHGAIKTSGATGLHIYLPLPAKTSLETARLVAELICTQAAENHENGTVERSVKKRKKGSVYLDSQQNYLSKSVAGVWAVRARPAATVSTPITRKELEAGVTPQDFTIVSVIPDAKKRAAAWNKLMGQPIDLKGLLSAGAGAKPKKKK